MNDARHDAASRIFTSAVNLPTDAREAYVRERAGGDDVLAATVLEWLAHDEGTGDGRVVVSDLARELDEHLAVDAPHAIGRYRLLDVIGHGGSSVVYRAQQQDLGREVALKLMHPAPVDERAVRRFELEAEILATLGHDGIAKIHESGTYETPFGARPYLAMELVRGRPITDHCDERGLDRDARLALLADTAEAIHHAHQNAVIHRDVKPGNVLVDEAGGVKVVDFGVARPFDASRARLTHDGAGPIGTLGYMSPEQIDGAWGTIDLRTDVYSLGVLAYRVLSGRLPYEFPVGSGQRSPGVEPPDMSRAKLGPDLEAVLTKATAADKRRRYGSAADLALDLRRVVAGEPVSARVPSRVERAWRGVRRHPVVATACLAAVGFLAQQQAHVAAQNRHVAQLEERGERDNRMRRTLQIMLSESSTPSLEPLLEPERYAWLIDEHPEEYADFLVMCARTIITRSEHREHRETALAHLREAARLRRGALGVEHPDTVGVTREVLTLLVGMRRAEPARRALADLRAIVLDEAPPYWDANLAMAEARLLCIAGDYGAALRVVDDQIAASGGPEQTFVRLVDLRADLSPAHEALADLRRAADVWAASAKRRDTPLRIKRMLQEEQKEALARLRLAVLDGDTGALPAIRRGLAEGHARRCEHYAPTTRFALWGGYAVMRAAAAQGDWVGLLELVEAQGPLLAGRYARADHLVVQTDAMHARALLGLGRVDEARRIVDDLAHTLAADVPDDVELAAQVGIVRAEVRAAVAPEAERRAILEAAHARWAPCLVPDDERVARLVSP